MSLTTTVLSGQEPVCVDLGSAFDVSRRVPQLLKDRAQHSHAAPQLLIGQVSEHCSCVVKRNTQERKHLESVVELNVHSTSGGLVGGRSLDVYDADLVEACLGYR